MKQSIIIKLGCFLTRRIILAAFPCIILPSINRVYAQQQHNDNVTPEERASIAAKAKSFYSKLGALKQSNEVSGEQLTVSHVLFAWPMRVNSNYDDIPNYYSTVNYWDMGSGTSEQDWRCGTRTYDGHNGVDIALWPFWWRMKDNYNVYAVAAAPGIVFDYQSSRPDDNCALSSTSANYVTLLHSDSSISYYYHVKNSGVLVNIGDVVTEGQPLAYIASSGRSTYPHLHFQVEDKNGNDIEPFKNSGSPDCNTKNTDTWWKNQKPYWEPQVNRVATHYSRPTLWGPDGDASDYFCREYEVARFKNNYSAGDSIYFYIYFQDLQNNDTWDIDVIDPSGTTWYSSSGTNSSATSAFTYKSYSRKLPSNAETGTWKVAITYRSVIYRHYFTVDCTSSYALSSQTGSYGRIASSYIQSTAITSNGNEVKLQAGSYLEFKPGFHAVSGSELKARIRSCNYSE